MKSVIKSYKNTKVTNIQSYFCDCLDQDFYQERNGIFQKKKKNSN